MGHTYSEIRNVALAILAGREHTTFPTNKFSDLKIGVAEVFRNRERPNQPKPLEEDKLEAEDAEIFREVFWDLFLDRIIVIGMDESNGKFPWFRLRISAREKIECELQNKA